MSFRPLSSRGKPNVALDSLYEGVPAHLTAPFREWVRPFLVQDYRGTPRTVFINRFAMALRPDPPLDQSSEENALEDIWSRMHENDEFALDLADYALFCRNQPYYRNELSNESRPEVLLGYLNASGSVWTIEQRVPADDEPYPGFRLVRRDLGEAKASVERILEEPGRAGNFLAAAWNGVAGRDPQPSDAYDKAVKAVEASMHPIVSPSDADATLGKMRSALRDKPSKWSFVSPVTPELILSMTESLWSGQMRHGTDKRFGIADDARTDHTVKEAEAALHIAIALVGFFQGGHVVRA